MSAHTPTRSAAAKSSSTASTASTAHIRNLAFWQSNQSKWKANSTVLITGAGSGIGREIAMIYARRRCKLVLGDINADALKPVVERCIEVGNPYHTLLCGATHCHIDQQNSLVLKRLVYLLM
jgi:hypothetical protein